jgi:threonine/homoserine/homoserine lactone efflux protein
VANLVALAAATAVLVIIPGPNAALIVANTVKHGFRTGALTVFGTTAGVAAQLVLVVFGLAIVIEVAAEILTWIRWAGVVYLVYLGIRTWHEPASGPCGASATPNVFWRGCLIAAVNPKTLLFNAAFLPQFVGSEVGVAMPAVVAAVYLGILLAGDLIWAAAAGSAARLFDRLADRRNRISGGVLVAAGVGLALSRRGGQ